MREAYKVAVIGDGRVGRAAAHYLKSLSFTGKVDFLAREDHASRYDLLIGALPGEIGGRCLESALRYRKNLIDISDIDPPF